MTRLSKQRRKRQQYPHKRRSLASKTGAKKDNLPLGFKAHHNVLNNQMVFIPKIK